MGMNALAQLYMKPRTANEFEREEIMGKAYDFKAFAVRENLVVLLLDDGRLFLEVVKNDVVACDWYPKDKWERVGFWFNKSSLKDLGDRLRKSNKRIKINSCLWEWR
jgi:hypothetical protein